MQIQRFMLIIILSEICMYITIISVILRPFSNDLIFFGFDCGMNFSKLEVKYFVL